MVRIDAGGRIIESVVGTSPLDTRRPMLPPPPARVSDQHETSGLVPQTPPVVLTTPPRKEKFRATDPLTQSLVLLATMTIMLLAARFVVPRIVEEIRYAWLSGELRAEYDAAGDGLKNVSLDSLSDAYHMVTSAVGPSVVHIDVSSDQPIATQTDGDRLKRWLLGDPNRSRPTDRVGPGTFPTSEQGSGVVVDDQGYILTNEHVIAGGNRITVTLSDGRRRTAELIGRDKLTDLALLKIDADRLIPVRWGDSDQCRVGSPVWAVGSPFGLDRTVTFGILSGKHRRVRASERYQDFMQSDVAVNPGNSGGPLVDATASLVGINTAIVGETYRGVSFSIPSNVARQIYENLRDTGTVQRAWLGVSLAEVPDDFLVGENTRVRGALVMQLADNVSPAALADIRRGDIIMSMDGDPIRDTGHLMQRIGATIVGTKTEFEIRRGGDTLKKVIRLSARVER